jgi:hypothetical protein
MDITGGGTNYGGNAFTRLIHIIVRSLIASDAYVYRGSSACDEIYIANEGIVDMIGILLRRLNYHMELHDSESDDRMRRDETRRAVLREGKLKSESASASVFMGPGIDPATMLYNQYIAVGYHWGLFGNRHVYKLRDSLRMTLENPASGIRRVSASGRMRE